MTGISSYFHKAVKIWISGIEYWNDLKSLEMSFLKHAGSEGHAVGHVFIKNKNTAKQVTLLLAVSIRVLLTLQHTLLMHSPYQHICAKILSPLSQGSPNLTHS